MPTPQFIEVDHPLADGNPPRWASAWGEDCYGCWVEFRVGETRQRMRWILPGSFLMGSPEDEAGRFDHEGPQHLVQITEGFWLFETPCTQQLWEAVTGNNPSRFQSPDRPVEQVTWEDCQTFLQQFSELVPGLQLTLPTEAEWEYACRAGTVAATYAGDLEILGLNNAPVLDEIAWYGGNCGIDFDLDTGASIDWGEKQYEFDTGGTRPVAQNRPNPWGLHDMLGNVLELCRDGKRDYTDEPVQDLMGSTVTSADRVFRGGSWFGPAQFARAACRGCWPPSYQYSNLGFRCSSS